MGKKIGLTTIKLMKYVFFSFLVLCVAGISYGQAGGDTSGCDVTGNLCKKVLVAYGPDAQRNNAVLYQEHFCKDELESGSCWYSSEPEDDRAGELLYKEKKDYDDGTRLVHKHAEVISQDGTMVSSEFTFTYDEEGKLKEEMQVSTNNPIPLKLSYKYDPNGRLIKVSEFLGTVLQRITNFEYDPEGQGQKTKEIDFLVIPGNENKESASFMFTYNSNKKLVKKIEIQQVEVQNTGQLKTTEYTYAWDENEPDKLLEMKEEANFEKPKPGTAIKYRKKIQYYEYPPFGSMP